MLSSMRKILTLIILLTATFFISFKVAGGNHSIKPPDDNNSEYYIKYFISHGIDINNESNLQLYKYIYGWLGTPHFLGGKSKKGIDCSGFVEKVYEAIYNCNLKGAANDILNKIKTIKKEDIKEGDLLFFKKQGRIYHVALYLSNNKFIHAATKKGVMLNDLNENYYKKYFFTAGRLDNDFNNNAKTLKTNTLKNNIKVNNNNICFKIQIGVFNKVLDMNDSLVIAIKKITGENISYIKSSKSIYKYYIGSFKTIDDARLITDKIKENTKIKDAFVVAFKNNQRINLKEAIKDF
jgi:lipoprotein Spr